MKQTFQVALTKSFLVTIEAENEQSALELLDFFTSDILDLSSETEKNEHKFYIDKIEHTYTSKQIIS